MKKEIQIEITDNCNLNCIHCSSLALRNKKYPENVSPAKVANLIKNIPGTKHVYFTGGEPLTAPNLIQYCQVIIQEKDTSLGLFTSGVIKAEGSYHYVSPSIATKLKANGISDCYISIYGTNADTHNQITGLDSFHSTCQSISNLKNAGIHVRAHIVLNKYNIDHIEDFYRFAEDRGIESIRLLHLVKSGMAINSWGEIGVTTAKEIEAIKYAISIAPSYPKVSMSVSGFPELMPCRPGASALGCQRGSSVIYITFSGEVYPCACAKNMKSLMLGTLDNIPDILNALKKYDNNPYCEKCLNTI